MEFLESLPSIHWGWVVGIVYVAVWMLLGMVYILVENLLRWDLSEGWNVTIIFHSALVFLFLMLFFVVCSMKLIGG